MGTEPPAPRLLVGDERAVTLLSEVLADEPERELRLSLVRALAAGDLADDDISTLGEWVRRALSD